jgi:hypothetical protein
MYVHPASRHWHSREPGKGCRPDAEGLGQGPERPFAFDMPWSFYYGSSVKVMRLRRPPWRTSPRLLQRLVWPYG